MKSFILIPIINKLYIIQIKPKYFFYYHNLLLLFHLNDQINVEILLILNQTNLRIFIFLTHFDILL